MSVYKRGDVWHFDFTFKGERYRGPTGHRSKAKAQRFEEDERERVRTTLGKPAQRAELTIEAAAAKWFQARAADTKSAKTTAQRLEIMLRLIGPQTLVSEIDAPEVLEAIQKRRLEPTRQSTKKTVRFPSNATVNRDLIDTTLRPILRFSKRALKQKVQDIDWSELRLQEPKERVRAFTPADLDEWAKHLPEWHRPIRDFIGRYGVRLREAFFPLAAIDTETWEITVSGDDRKNGRPHIIPLLDEDARDIAARLTRAREAGLDTIWFRERRNRAGVVTLEPIHWRGFQSASKAALVKAGIADARPAHDLRHHAGTAAMRAGGNLKVVQMLLGHESIASTARYAHADTSDVRRILRHTVATTDEKEPEKPDNSSTGTET